MITRQRAVPGSKWSPVTCWLNRDERTHTERSVVLQDVLLDLPPACVALAPVGLARERVRIEVRLHVALGAGVGSCRATCRRPPRPSRGSRSGAHPLPATGWPCTGRQNRRRRLRTSSSSGAADARSGDAAVRSWRRALCCVSQRAATGKTATARTGKAGRWSRAHAPCRRWLRLLDSRPGDIEQRVAVGARGPMAATPDASPPCGLASAARCGSLAKLPPETSPPLRPASRARSGLLAKLPPDAEPPLLAIARCLSCVHSGETTIRAAGATADYAAASNELPVIGHCVDLHIKL